MDAEKLKNTKVLKDLPQMQGTTQRHDFFVIYEDDNYRVGIKMAIEPPGAMSAPRLLARIRIMNNAKVDLPAMGAVYEEYLKPLKDTIMSFAFANSWKRDNLRVSFCCYTEKTLVDYGDFQEEWDKTMTEFDKDLMLLGRQVTKAVMPLVVDQEKIKHLLGQMFVDWQLLLKPDNPNPDKKAKKKASVTSIKKKKVAKKKVEDTTFKEAAEEILSDICGEPTTIELVDGDEPKVKPKK